MPIPNLEQLIGFGGELEGDGGGQNRGTANVLQNAQEQELRTENSRKRPYPLLRFAKRGPTWTRIVWMQP
jgi:hypothetical protein